MSGRGCDQIFAISLRLDTVLRECAVLLGLDPDAVAKGRLVRGTTEIIDLWDLQDRGQANPEGPNLEKNQSRLDA